MRIQDKIQLANSGGFVRKPVRWSELADPIPLAILEQLYQYKAEDLGIAGEGQLGRTFNKTPEETLFLVSRNGGLYLVNTEGYDYVRYVRYVGAALTEKPDIVVLEDEHRQPVEILHRNDKFYWGFVENDDGDLEYHGPFDSRKEALEAAEEYCFEAAPGCVA